MDCVKSLARRFSRIDASHLHLTVTRSPNPIRHLEILDVERLGNKIIKTRSSLPVVSTSNVCCQVFYTKATWTMPAAAAAVKKPLLTPMEELLGTKLLEKAKGPKKDTNTLLKDKDLVALYFSASWCKPCQTFSPLLMEFYDHIEGMNVDVVFVSSDRTTPEFDEYYGHMPWLAIPSDAGAAKIKNNLSQRLKIQGIPSLIVVDAKTGEFVSDKARYEVTGTFIDEKQAQGIVTKWKGLERKPLDQGILDGQEPGGIKGLIMMLLKSPASIFAILYIYRNAGGWFKEIMDRFKQPGTDNEL